MCNERYEDRVIVSYFAPLKIVFQSSLKSKLACDRTDHTQANSIQTTLSSTILQQSFTTGTALVAVNFEQWLKAIHRVHLSCGSTPRWRNYRTISPPIRLISRNTSTYKMYISSLHLLLLSVSRCTLRDIDDRTFSNQNLLDCLQAISISP